MMIIGLNTDPLVQSQLSSTQVPKHRDPDLKDFETGLSLWILKLHAVKIVEKEVSDKDGIGFSN